MATGNFYNTNATRIYSITDGDDFTWENVRENITHDLEKSSKELKLDFYPSDDINLENELRSYPSTSIGELYTSIQYATLDIQLTLVPKTVSGYYEGFNLDYEIRIEDNLEGTDYESIVDLIDDSYDFNPENRGILTINRDRIITKVSTALKEMTDLVENVFNQNSQALNVVARFSNGEVMYESA